MKKIALLVLLCAMSTRTEDLSMYKTSPAWIYWDFDESMKLAASPEAFNFPMSIIGYNSREFYALCKELYKKNNPSVYKGDDELRIPKIIHQIWIGSPLPDGYEQYMDSWVKHHMGRDWQYILWTDEKVEKIKPLYNQSYYDEHPNYGVKADILKWELIYRYGGIYADLDQECVRPFDMFHYRYDFYAGLQPLDTKIPQLGASLFAARPGHPMLKHCIETIKNDWHKKGAPAKTGPIHMTNSFVAMAGKNGMKDIAFPAHYFFPYSDREFIRGTAILTLHEWVAMGSFAVHHWAKSWMPAHLRLPAHRGVKNEETTKDWNN